MNPPPDDPCVTLRPSVPGDNKQPKIAIPPAKEPPVERGRMEWPQVPSHLCPFDHCSLTQRSASTKRQSMALVATESVFGSGSTLSKAINILLQMLLFLPGICWVYGLRCWRNNCAACLDERKPCVFKFFLYSICFQVHGIQLGRTKGEKSKIVFLFP